jgi:acetylornithine deacetylase/succinyl-diaminopimelate desuccinylase-like protein
MPRSIGRRLAAPLAAALLLCAASANGAEPKLSEAAAQLREYLRVDTHNPPGSEHLAAAFLAGVLRREGIDSRLFVTPEGRTSLWAELAAADPAAERIVLLHHMDVVEPGSGWSVPPYSGTVRDGALYGRGALDAKSLGIAHLAAFVDLKRSGARLQRGVVFLATADEESGGGAGTAFLWREHPELFDRVVAVLNEGGNNRRASDRLLWWGVEVTQKRPLWLEVSTTGRAGHASGLQPHSAVHSLVEALARLLALPPRWRVSDGARRYLGAVAPLHNDHWRSIFTHLDEAIAPEGPRTDLLPGLANLFLDSVQVTVVRAGESINSIPAEASARIDIRLLPDTDSASALARVEKALGSDVTVRVLLQAPPSGPSPADGPVFAAFARVLGAEAPVVPSFISGFTDSRYFREHGIAAYGLSPFALAADEQRGIHGPDESIPLAEFDRGVERMKRLLTALAAEPLAAK